MRRRGRRLTVEEMRQHLIDRMGWSAAHAWIAAEAANMHVSPEAASAVRSAYITYQHTHKQPEHVQEGLI